jgi:hypothetical protein
MSDKICLILDQIRPYKLCLDMGLEPTVTGRTCKVKNPRHKGVLTLTNLDFIGDKGSEFEGGNVVDFYAYATGLNYRESVLALLGMYQDTSPGLQAAYWQAEMIGDLFESIHTVCTKILNVETHRETVGFSTTFNNWDISRESAGRIVTAAQGTFLNKIMYSLDAVDRIKHEADPTDEYLVVPYYSSYFTPAYLEFRPYRGKTNLWVRLFNPRWSYLGLRTTQPNPDYTFTFKTEEALFHTFKAYELLGDLRSGCVFPRYDPKGSIVAHKLGNAIALDVDVTPDDILAMRRSFDDVRLCPQSQMFRIVFEKCKPSSEVLVDYCLSFFPNDTESDKLSLFLKNMGSDSQAMKSLKDRLTQLGMLGWFNEHVEPKRADRIPYNTGSIVPSNNRYVLSRNMNAVPFTNFTLVVEAKYEFRTGEPPMYAIRLFHEDSVDPYDMLVPGDTMDSSYMFCNMLKRLEDTFPLDVETPPSLLHDSYHDYFSKVLEHLRKSAPLADGLYSLGWNHDYSAFNATGWAVEYGSVVRKQPLLHPNLPGRFFYSSYLLRNGKLKSVIPWHVALLTSLLVRSRLHVPCPPYLLQGTEVNRRACAAMFKVFGQQRPIPFTEGRDPVAASNGLNGYPIWVDGGTPTASMPALVINQAGMQGPVKAIPDKQIEAVSSVVFPQVIRALAVTHMGLLPLLHDRPCANEGMDILKYLMGLPPECEDD